MARGWVYTGCEDTYPGGNNASNDDTGEGSIQFRNGSLTVTGSNTLTFTTASATHEMRLTGTLSVSGAINATSYNVRSVTTIDSIGSTVFGDTSDDTHQITGSIRVKGAATATPTLYTDGSNYRVGIGDSSPDALLDLQGAAATGVPTLLVDHDDTDKVAISVLSLIHI